MQLREKAKNMKSIHLVRLSLVGMLLLLTLMPTGMVWAKPPLMGTDQFVWDGLMGPYEVNCGDFLAYEHVEIDLRWVDFFDGDGNFVREQAYWSATGYAYNPNDSTLSLVYSPVHYKETFTAAGEHTIVGLWVNVPGEGRVWHDAGRLEFTDYGYELDFTAGRHDYYEGNTDALCAALSP